MQTHYKLNTRNTCKHLNTKIQMQIQKYIYTHTYIHAYSHTFYSLSLQNANIISADPRTTF